MNRNTFSYVQEHHTSFEIGKLVPVFNRHCIPAERVSVVSNKIARTLALKVPEFHPHYLTEWGFWIPYRILWSNWNDFIRQESEHVLPFVNGLVVTNNTLSNYFGFPKEILVTEEVNAFKFAAYNKIYDEFFRSDHLGTEQFKPLVDGANNTEVGAARNGEPYNRAYSKDYITTALPEAQLGQAVTIPLTIGDTLPVELDPSSLGTNALLKSASSHGLQLAADVTSDISGNLNRDSTGNVSVIDPNGTLMVNANDDAATVASLRKAVAIQEFFELLNRGGNRIQEWLWSVFRVKYDNKLLDIPEYLGGSKVPVQISEVLATAESTGVPVGDLAGHGLAAGSSPNYTHFCKEYGIFMIIANVQPTNLWWQGIDKCDLRREPFDYPVPQLANIGEQPILNKEVYAGGATQAEADATFGYTERYAEQKTGLSRISGEFRDTLNIWHNGREFINTPVLNNDFLTVNSSDHLNIFAVAGVHQIQASFYFKVKVDSPLPMFGAPKL